MGERGGGGGGEGEGGGGGGEEEVEVEGYRHGRAATHNRGEKMALGKIFQMVSPQGGFPEKERAEK